MEDSVDIHISSIAELTEAISVAAENYDGPIWYRGQINHSWSLLPGFYRGTGKLTEHSLLTKFRQSATMLIERPAQDPFEWMFLMQHYGVPTRLLDWSESPLVALYFCVNVASEEDAALWMLKPSKLNENSRIQAKAEDGYLLSFQDEELQNYTIESLRNNERVRLLPLATIAVRNNPRIQAQSGVFTIHHHERIPIEKVGTGRHAFKLRIRKEVKETLRNELRLLGVSQFQLFPELASVGAILKEEMK